MCRLGGHTVSKRDYTQMMWWGPFTPQPQREKHLPLPPISWTVQAGLGVDGGEVESMRMTTTGGTAVSSQHWHDGDAKMQRSFRLRGWK